MLAAYDHLIVTPVTVRVPAKVNLQLAVGPLRADGYHDLVTVFHAVSLFDEVTFRPAARTSPCRPRWRSPGPPGPLAATVRPASGARPGQPWRSRSVSASR